MAENGIHVVGVDSSPAMLSRLREKLAEKADKVSKKIELFEQDMRVLDLPNRYRLIIVPFRAFLHMLTDLDRRAALRAMANHLAPEGRIAIHTFGPLYQLLAQEHRVLPIRERALPDGRRLMGEDRVFYDHNEQVIVMERVLDVTNGDGSVRRQVLPLKLAYVFPGELTLTAELCELSLDALYGDFEKNDYRYPDRIEAVHVFKHADN